MTALSITRAIIDGFDSLQVQTGLIELSMIADLGGKINSLRDARTGREWLWRHPRLPYKRMPHGSSFVAEADTGGWDECFPSVSACEYPSAPWKGAQIQDHGELWSQAPEVEINEQAEHAAIRTRWQGVSLPYTFTRTLNLTANSSCLRVEYAVSNNSDQPINFVWCIHPLLAIEPGMELRLPAAARFNLAGTQPPNMLSHESNLSFPFSVPALSLPILPSEDAGVAVKIWSDSLPQGEGWAALAASDGELRMRWDVEFLPQAAVWMNFGAWAGDGGVPYYNLGLEPCIGAQDSLADAVTQFNKFASIPPFGKTTWWLEIELSV